jgi:hypothetical protein
MMRLLGRRQVQKVIALGAKRQQALETGANAFELFTLGAELRRRRVRLRLLSLCCCCGRLVVVVERVSAGFSSSMYRCRSTSSENQNLHTLHRNIVELFSVLLESLPVPQT